MDRGRPSMSPLACTSLPSFIEDFRTDEEVVLFLGGRTSGDPLPSNIITEVNPFSFDPWNAPDNMWYLCNLMEPISPKGRREIINTSGGYWKDMGCDVKIFTNSHTVGRKVTWQFFPGAVPSGNKISWTMLEYKLETKEFEAADKVLEFNALYRIFRHSKHLPAFEEQQNPVSLGDADGDYVQSLFLSMLEQEEENIDLVEPTCGSQGLLAISNGNLEDSRPDHSTEFNEACDFLHGDFLELKDLYDPQSSNGDFLELKDLYDPKSSSSSDNSSCVSRSSDDYFDSEALLRDLDNEGKLIAGRHHTEHNFNVSQSLRTNRVVWQPPSQGSMQNNGADLVEGEISATSVSGRGPQLIGSLSILPVNRNDGASGHSWDNKKRDLTSQHAGTSQGLVKNRVGRIAKLGKKYFCFASY